MFLIGFILVDDNLKTNNEKIFAVGDVIGGPLFAHKASYEGKCVAELIAGKREAIDKKIIPAVMYTDSEVAWCGLTELEAKARGIEIKIAKFPWQACGRALTMGIKSGVTKLIIDPKTEKILGAGIIGKHAGELLSECVLAIETGIKASELAEIIHAHPSLSETIKGAAEVFLGSATEIITR